MEVIMDKKSINVLFDEDVVQKLEKIAKKEGKTMSDVVRNAVDNHTQYFRKNRFYRGRSTGKHGLNGTLHIGDKSIEVEIKYVESLTVFDKEPVGSWPGYGKTEVKVLVSLPMSLCSHWMHEYHDPSLFGMSFPKDLLHKKADSPYEMDMFFTKYETIGMRTELSDPFVIHEEEHVGPCREYQTITLVDSIMPCYEFKKFGHPDMANQALQWTMSFVWGG
jgi:hypothetical protein